MRIDAISSGRGRFLVALATAILFPVTWILLGVLLLPVLIGIPILLIGGPIIAGAYPFLGAGTSSAPVFAPAVGVVLSLVQWVLLSLLLTVSATRLQFTTTELVVATGVAILVMSGVAYVVCGLLGVPLESFSLRT